MSLCTGILVEDYSCLMGSSSASISNYLNPFLTTIVRSDRVSLNRNYSKSSWSWAEWSMTASFMLWGLVPSLTQPVQSRRDSSSLGSLFSSFGASSAWFRISMIYSLLGYWRRSLCYELFKLNSKSSSSSCSSFISLIMLSCYYVAGIYALDCL